MNSSSCYSIVLGISSFVCSFVGGLARLSETLCAVGVLGVCSVLLASFLCLPVCLLFFVVHPVEVTLQRQVL